jgi:hypothetical protein
VPTFRYRLLFVGVNTVPGHPPLYAARRDAEAMSTRFVDWGYDRRGCHRLLVGPDATAEKVRQELQHASSSDPADLVLVYWAGHLENHGRKHTLATVDGQGVALEDITASMAATPAKHRVLILDACNAAGAHGPLTAFARQVDNGHAVAVFAGGGTDGMSREDLRRGYFTGALLEQLPRYTRGLSPEIDLLQALRGGAEQMPARRSEQAFVAVTADATIHLPQVKAKTLPFERRTRVGRQPARQIAASA